MRYMRAEDDDPSKGIAILLQDKQGCIALQLRDDKPGVKHPDHWGLFSGLMKLTGQPDEEILREVKEELGCSLDPIKLNYLRIFRT